MLVLAILSLVLASISSTLARPAPVPATVLAARGPPALGPRKTRSYGYQPIRWLTRFGGEVVADGSIDLEWTGGSGQGYEVYFIPQWPELEQYYVSYVPFTLRCVVRSAVTKTDPTARRYRLDHGHIIQVAGTQD
jgi:hypothetical protein